MELNFIAIIQQHLLLINVTFLLPSLMVSTRTDPTQEGAWPSRLRSNMHVGGLFNSGLTMGACVSSTKSLRWQW